MNKCLLSLILFATAFLFSEITFNRSSVDYSVRKEFEGKYFIVSFRKSPDDSVYTYLKYSGNSKSGSFDEQMAMIDSLWTLAEDSIKIGLNAADLGYPLEFKSKLEEYIRAFLDSEDWMVHVTLKGKELNYDLMHKVIYENDIYPEITKLFNKRKYTVTGVSTEKHGFIPKVELVKYGFTGDEIIPIPFMLYWKLEEIEDKPKIKQNQL